MAKSKKATQTENTEVGTLKIDKGISSPTTRDYGVMLGNTLKSLKVVTETTKPEDTESIEIPKDKLSTLKYQVSKFSAGTFATSVNKTTGGTRVWKIKEE